MSPGPQVADASVSVGLSLFKDFENFAAFKPRALHEPLVGAMLDQLEGWGRALKALREGTLPG